MATVTFAPETPVPFSTLTLGHAYRVEENGTLLFRKTAEDARLKENIGQIEPESAATPCFPVAESRISISVAP